MERAGLEVERHPYDVYLPELTDDVEVHIVTPVSMQLSNREPALPEDRFSGHPDLLNGWNAYSGSGDVTAEVVYANFGRREDYLALDSMGVSVAGKVVIARYGGISAATRCCSPKSGAQRASSCSTIPASPTSTPIPMAR